MNIQDLFGTPEPGSLTVSDDLRRVTEETQNTQRTHLENWEKDPSTTSLEELCNAYLVTSDDVAAMKEEQQQYYDDAGKEFLSKTLTWTDEALVRLKKLIATVAAQ